MPPTPKVNDQFWLDKAEEIINDSIDNLNKGISSMNTFIIALWTIYTASSIFTINYLEITDDKFIFYILLPHAVLFLGRCVTLLGQLPINIKFDARAPALIENAYRKTYRWKKVYLIIGIFFSIIATIGMILVLSFAFIEKNNLSNKKFVNENRVKPDLQIQLNKSKQLILLKAEVSPNTPVEISSILILDQKDTLKLDEENFISSSQGMVNWKIITPMYEQIVVKSKISWFDSKENILKSLEKNIISRQTPKKDPK